MPCFSPLLSLTPLPLFLYLSGSLPGPNDLRQQNQIRRTDQLYVCGVWGVSLLSSPCAKNSRLAARPRTKSQSQIRHGLGFCKARCVERRNNGPVKRVDQGLLGGAGELGMLSRDPLSASRTKRCGYFGLDLFQVPPMAINQISVRRVIRFGAVKVRLANHIVWLQAFSPPSHFPSDTDYSCATHV